MRALYHLGWSALALLLLSACQTAGGRDTIAKLRNTQIDVKEEKIEGGLEKAMEGYRHFLEETPDSALSAEAIRRLADLKVEREYGALSGTAAQKGQAAAVPSSKPAVHPEVAPAPLAVPVPAQNRAKNESQDNFEKRAVQMPAPGKAADKAADESIEAAGDLERANTVEAVELYKKLLDKYPDYEHNDQVLYQMSRAYEEMGKVEEAMQVMNRIVREYPKSRYLDEVQFRRAEYFFTRKRYLDAEDAYASIVTLGPASSYYQLALYKLGWTFYKQELYEEDLDRFIALLDYKVSTGYDFAQTSDQAERKQIDDTFRVISLSFSNLGGASSVVEYFNRHGKRSYEDGIYGNLGEFYFGKQRYSDAAAAYNAFVSRNPFHKLAPQFDMRAIEINVAGGFPSLVIDGKKQFVRNYGLQAGYWQHFEPAARPEVLAWLKTNITDLAKFYHALYQDPKESKEKQTNYEEALHWYREFLATFPKDAESPAINYLLADLLMQNGSYDLAAVEYEKTAYEYPRHDKSPQAGYAAVYAWRQHLAAAAAGAKDTVKREIVRSSLKFVDAYPEHEKAAVVLGAAADDLYTLRDFEPAVSAARKLIEAFPRAEADVARQAWLVVGHSTYELHRYSEAETAYVKVLAMLPAGDKSRDALTDNLAASIYRQGEQANAAKDYRAAADHFLRVGRMAPASKIRVNAEYDAAAALIQLKDWKTAAAVLTGFREKFPGHELQPEVTEKIAFVYREDGQFALAAEEYERIERESKDEEVRREALLTAAELHEKAGNQDRMLAVYRRYVEYFPHPVEPNLETRSKIAEVLKKRNEQDNYIAELKSIVIIDAGAEDERTPRTRSLAGKAALVLAEQIFDQFAAVKLVEPFKVNLEKKKALMKTATQEFDKLIDYEVGEITAAATFYLAEIYARFSRDLRESERPTGLSALEREEYELAIEDQAYPFEEKAITTHKKNLELISLGVYNEWIDKSLQKLAKFIPSRYDKPEEESPVITSPDIYQFAIARPEPPMAQAGEAKQPDKDQGTAKAAEPKQDAKPDGTTDAVQAGGSNLETKPVETQEPAQTAAPKSDVKQTEISNAEPAAKSKRIAKAAASKNATPKAKSKSAGTSKAAQSVTSKQHVKPAEAKVAAKSNGAAQTPDRGSRGAAPGAAAN